MDIGITILVGAITGLIGFFLRDIYVFIKRKFFKSTKPKVVLEYQIRSISACGTNPRKYKFQGKILIQNIDPLPIYNLRLIYKDHKTDNEVLRENHLSQNDKKEISNEKEITFGDTGTDFESAKKELPELFRNPNYLLFFENKDGHKFSQKVIIR